MHVCACVCMHACVCMCLCVRVLNRYENGTRYHIKVFRIISDTVHIVVLDVHEGDPVVHDNG